MQELMELVHRREQWLFAVRAAARERAMGEPRWANIWDGLARNWFTLCRWSHQRCMRRDAA